MAIAPWRATTIACATLRRKQASILVSSTTLMCNNVTPRAEVVQTPYKGGFHDLFIQSNQQLPLIQNPSTFQHVDLYDNEYEERKSFRSNNFDV
jgi:hypothetical protein